MNIAINEIFYSIQGEGPNAGTPAIFIRFQGCQLRCPWCDTGKALDPDDPHKDMSVNEIIAAIEHLPCRHIVITGGDPSFQMEGLDTLTAALTKQGYSLEIETSAIKPVPQEICRRFSQINVGLKLPGATQEFKGNYYSNAANHYQPLEQSIFKFVISSESDVDYIVDKLVANGLIDPEKIFLMPLGDTVEQQTRNTPYVISACKKHNFRFSPRLHITFGLK